MSKKRFNRIALALAVLSVPVLSGCGSSEPTGTPAPGNVPGSSLPGAGGCVPVTQQIPFTANNAYMAMRKIMAGQVPYQQAYGQVLIGGAVAGGGMYQGSGPFGTISMNITPVGQPQPGQPLPPGGGFPTTYPGGINPYSATNVNATGFIQVSALAQQNIMMAVQTGQIQIPGYTGGGYGYPYPQPYPQPGAPAQPTAAPQQICVSGIALSLNISAYNQLYIGDVYLYLNNTQHGFVLEF